MLITDAQLIGEAGIGQQQHRSLLVLQQCVGGHGGAQSNTADPTGGNHPVRSTTDQVRHRGHGRVAALGRLRQHLADMQLTLGVTTDQIGEGSPAIHPEGPAHPSIHDDSHHPAVPDNGGVIPGSPQGL